MKQTKTAEVNLPTLSVITWHISNLKIPIKRQNWPNESKLKTGYSSVLWTSSVFTFKNIDWLKVKIQKKYTVCSYRKGIIKWIIYQAKWILRNNATWGCCIHRWTKPTEEGWQPSFGWVILRCHFSVRGLAFQKCPWTHWSLQQKITKVSSMCANPRVRVAGRFLDWSAGIERVSTERCYVWSKHQRWGGQNRWVQARARHAVAHGQLTREWK